MMMNFVAIVVVGSSTVLVSVLVRLFGCCVIAYVTVVVTVVELIIEFTRCMVPQMFVFVLVTCGPRPWPVEADSGFYMNVSEMLTLADASSSIYIGALGCTV